MHSQQTGDEVQANTERELQSESARAALDNAPPASEVPSVNSPDITTGSPSTAAMSKGESCSLNANEVCLFNPQSPNQLEALGCRRTWMFCVSGFTGSFVS